MNLKNYSFTKEWTLFLDRDGVISRRVHNGYVNRWEEFEFLDGVLDSIHSLRNIFGRIIIVSNQQGVGKGLMTHDDLKLIDRRMREVVLENGGRIDAAYYCTHLESENHTDRKPGTGMGLRAKADFPEIDFHKSVMVGDSSSDIEFGKRLGMITVFLSNNQEEYIEADFFYNSLKDFTEQLIANNE